MNREIRTEKLLHSSFKCSIVLTSENIISNSPFPPFPQSPLHSLKSSSEHSPESNFHILPFTHSCTCKTICIGGNIFFCFIIFTLFDQLNNPFFYCRQLFKCLIFKFLYS